MERVRERGKSGGYLSGGVRGLGLTISAEVQDQLLRDLSVMQLRIMPGTGHLRAKATAQLIAKALYLGGEPRTRDQLVRDAPGLLGVPALPREDLDAGLDLLREGGLLSHPGTRWDLTPETRRAVELDLETQNDWLNATLRERFPQNLPGDQLRRWFLQTLARFFERYGTEMVATLYRQPVPKFTPVLLADLIGGTAAQCGIAEHAESLHEGFRGFLNFPTPTENLILGSAMQAVFSARLIAARIGADPLSVANLRDSTVVLDTNLLATAQLEAHRNYKALQSLALVLARLNLRLVMLPATVEEYRRLLEAQRADILRVVGNYRPEVVRRASDAFLNTASARGCARVEDYERFFDSIADPPSDVGGIAVETLEADSAPGRDADAFSRDQTLLAAVAGAWRKARPGGKRPNALAHDAGVLGAVEAARTRGERIWVLTEDLTMCSLAVERQPMEVVPTWIAEAALVQILAAEFSGPDFSAEDYGALLGVMIENDLQPVVGTFKAEDLAVLLDVDTRFADLADEAIAETAREAARARLRGSGRNDQRLQAELQQAFQRHRTKAVAQSQEREALLATTQRDLRAERARRSSVELSLREELTRQYRPDVTFRTRRDVVLLLLGFIVLVAIGVSLLMIGADNVLMGTAVALAFGGAISAAVASFRRVRSGNEEWRAAPTRAAAEVRRRTEAS